MISMPYTATEATDFAHNFRQIKILLKNATVNWFDGNKNLRDSELLVFRTLWKLRNLLPATVSQKFRQINVSLKNVNMYWFDGKNLCGTQRGNYGNSLSRIFGKNSVKTTVLLNKLQKSWFDEIFFHLERISRFSTLCSSEFLVFKHRASAISTLWTLWSQIWQSYE